MNAKSIFSRLSDLEFPTFSQDVTIPVFMVHNSRDPEDYFFLFDFEEFVRASDKGFFARPILQVFAGRDDFSRALFAREFRRVFALEFDRMRLELAAAKGKRGWLSWASLNPVDLIAGLASSIVLATALSIGNLLTSRIKILSRLKGPSDEAALAAEVETLKSKVEAALEGLGVTLHPELYDHAYRDGLLGPNAKLDRDAWPLPSYVRDHLSDGESGSWW